MKQPSLTAKATAARTAESIYNQIETHFASGETPEKALSMCDMWVYDKKENNEYVITGKILHGDIATTTIKLIATYAQEMYLDVVSFIQEPLFYGTARKRGKIGHNDTCVITVDKL